MSADITVSLFRITRRAPDGIAAIDQAVNHVREILMPQESLPSRPIMRARRAYALLLCLCPLLFGACLYGQRWEHLAAGEARHPVTLKWEPIAPHQDLTAVSFVDERRGWAVGEAGTILHTADGGRSWQPQTGGTDQDINTVFFLPDGLRGWAGGGNNHYDTGTEISGVILHTRDGGKSWQTQHKGSEQLVSHLQFSPDGLRGRAANSETILYTENGRVQTLSGDRRAWEDWLLNFENTEGFPMETEGFLLALQVCVTTYRDRFRIPELPWPWYKH